VVVSHTSSFNAKRNGGAGVEESGGVVEVGNLDPGCNKEGEDYKQVLDGWFE
jgi:hypothetical protein